MYFARLAQLKPALRMLLLERGDSLGGNHTWSFHDADLNAGQRAWVEPVVAHKRRVEASYAGKAAHQRNLGDGQRGVCQQLFGG